MFVLCNLNIRFWIHTSLGRSSGSLLERELQQRLQAALFRTRERSKLFKTKGGFFTSVMLSRDTVCISDCITQSDASQKLPKCLLVGRTGRSWFSRVVIFWPKWTSAFGVRPSIDKQVSALSPQRAYTLFVFTTRTPILHSLEPIGHSLAQCNPRKLFESASEAPRSMNTVWWAVLGLFWLLFKQCYLIY